ncbi:MAG: immunity 43 family protein [Prevotella sp.]|jgi:hypothetical protein|nr:immunity 43 family protein [Prevotella sp.]
MKGDKTTTDLFIWYNRTKVSKGIPSFDKVILKNEFDLNKPKKIPEQAWTLYNALKMRFPVTEQKYKFPPEMYLVVLNNLKDVCFDYIEHNNNVKLVSEDFYNFLIKYGLNEGHEKANLTILNTKGELLADKKYFALRFCLYDDLLFDFNKQSKVRVVGEFSGTDYVYPNICLANEETVSSVFVIKEPSYRNALIFKKDILPAILNNFYAPEIYHLKDFPFVFENRSNWDTLPFDNDYKVKKVQ